jgi:quercetin dioxygenase-like cupin family protein
MTADPKAVAWDDYALEKVTEMVSRRVHLERGTGTILVQTHLRKGALVPRHTHAGVQSVHVTLGAIRLHVAGAAVTLRVGEVVHIPGGTPHQVEVLEDSIVVDSRQGDVEF